jgi:glutaredoxin
MCQGCQTVKKTLERIGILYNEMDINDLSAKEAAQMITNLRISGWDGKIVYTPEGKPVLQAPILCTENAALWAAFILLDGKTVHPDVIDVLREMKIGKKKDEI